MKLIERMLGQNTLGELGLAMAIVVAVIVALAVVRRVAVRRLSTLAEKTETKLDDLIVQLVAATRVWLLAPVAVYVGAQVLEIPPKLDRLLFSIIIITVLLQAAFWGNRLIDFWLAYKVRQRMEGDAAAATTMAVLGFSARLALWAVVVLLALDNLGFNITTLVAGLGIGGIAIALAAQNILGDLFASLSIALDKPFLIGDFIIVDDKMGTVEYIGMKTTRLRSLSGEQLVFANTDLLGSRIRNYKRMHERRVPFTLGVIYGTPYEKLDKIPTIVREVIESLEQARFDRAHFKEYGDFALIFEIVYYVLDRDYTVYMNLQQAINLALFRRFAAEGIEFAYPTQTLYLHRSEAGTAIAR